MWYAVYGFVFGMLIPYMARRFSKFMPATMAYAVYRLVKPNQTVSKQKRAENPRYGKLVRRYLMRSVGWGILAAALSYLALHKFGSQYIGWHLAFIWILLLLTEIDNRMQLLPDILTVTLLLLGFAYAAFTGSWVVPAESAWGAGLGYLVPAAASLPFVFRRPDAFGGGDIKLLAALGAWLGFERLMYAVVAACVIFVMTVVVYRRKRDGAFGPSLAAAAILIAFYFF